MECAEIFEADQGMQKKKVFNLQVFSEWSCCINIATLRFEKSK